MPLVVLWFLWGRAEVLKKLLPIGIDVKRGTGILLLQISTNCFPPFRNTGC
jgi:hypothetical protein